MTALEDLKVLQSAEQVSDQLWREVSHWDSFARDVVGKQMCRAADSIGANLAESFGRFHYGEKLQFLYFSRGSLFETKYWLNRSMARQLMSQTEAQVCAGQLTKIGRQINAFANNLKSQKQSSHAMKEPTVLSENDLAYLSALGTSHQPQSPISNLHSPQ